MKIKQVKPTKDVKKRSEVTEESEDRSEFNCSDCSGEGLDPESNGTRLCTKCGGTGKVS